MKSLDYRSLNRYLTLILLFTFVLLVGQASGQDKVRARMSLQYFKDGENQKTLRATLKYKEDKSWKFIENATVTFYASTEEEDFELGEAISDEEGNAYFVLPENEVIPVDTATNFSLFLASYEGSDKFKSAENDVEIKDIKLNLKLDLIDSVKTVMVDGFEIAHDGELIPIEECMITLFVPRLYSNLPIEEGYIEEGEAEFEFPDDIPGRDNGELFVLLKIDDHEEYGTVEIKQEVNWGTPVPFVNEKMPKSLFGEAPLWMGFVIFGVLAAAWYHLFLVLFKLYRIKKLANN